MTALPPGSWLPADDPQIPDDVPHGCAVWVEDGRIRVEEDPMVSGPDDEDEDEVPKVRKLRPIGPRMAEALEFIRANPGVCKAEVYRGANVGRDRDGIDPIDRLLWRDLVYDLGPSHRYALYATDTPRPSVMAERQSRALRQAISRALSRPIDPEPVDDGYWRPAGHP